MDNNINNEIGIDEAYQNYLDELDAPRRYLEKTYPTFYNYFKGKYEEFLATWREETGFEFMTKQYQDDLFIDFCKRINCEIKSDFIIKDALNYIDKKGWPKPEPGKISLSANAVDQLIDTVLEFPEFIIYSLKKDSDNVKKRLAEWESKYGKYPKEIFRIAYNLQEDAKKKRLKLTAENAIVKANEEGKFYEPIELVNEYEQGTSLLFNLTQAYANHWKKKINKEEKDK